MGIEGILMLITECTKEYEVLGIGVGLRTRERWQRGKSTCIRVSRIIVDMRISTLYLHISYNLFLTCLYITIPINGIMADYSWFDRRRFPVFTVCIVPMRLL